MSIGEMGMHFLRFFKPSIAALLVMVLALPSTVVAQNPVMQQDYSKPKSHLPNLFAPYAPREVPEPAFSNNERINSMLREGKLYLSLSDAIILALENNLDLAIARYNLPIADTDVLRANAGSTVRGVATGLVQGTAGGGVGGFGTSGGGGAGGTSVGSGGSGSGAGGLVQSTFGTGASVDTYDPVLSANLQINHAAFPLSNTVTTGTAAFQQNTGTADFSYFQAFKTGTSVSVGFQNSRQTTNNRFTSLIPELSSSARLTFRQRLLNGFGLGPNTRFIRIARNNREISDVAFRNQVIATVSQIQNIYWDLVNAYEDVKVRERSVGLANKTLSDNRRQVEIGTLAPIEIVRAESEVATRDQELLVARTNLQLQQLLMKNAITRNLDDPTLAAADVIPTDMMELPAQEEVIPVQDLITQANASRAELVQARIDLTNRDINTRAARNALLPSLDLVAWYGGSGLAGTQNPSITCATSTCTASEIDAGLVPPGTIRRTGYNNAFSSIFDNNFPDYAVGLNLTIPLRNRAAQADQVRAELEERQAQLGMRQLQNRIGIEVRNAQYSVQQNRARVEAARKGRELAQQSLDAEQKRYALGASTNFQVLQAQRDLAQAESNLVTAMSAYHRARVELDRVVGTTLERLNISVGEVEQGQVATPPSLPGVVPNPEANKQ
jgi:outer membrane protein